MVKMGYIHWKTKDEGTTMNGIIKCPKCGRNMMVSKHVNEDNTQDVVCLKCGYRTKKQII